jgi:hypothetical protein
LLYIFDFKDYVNAKELWSEKERKKTTTYYTKIIIHLLSHSYDKGENIT